MTSAAEIKRPGAKLLRKLQLSELSLVDRPANPGARVAIWKRSGSLTPVTVLKDGSAVYAPPANSGMERGQTVKAATAPTPDHDVTGHVIADGYGGLAVRFGKRSDLTDLTRRAAAVEQKLNTLTAPPTAATKAKEPKMSEQTRLEKAAQQNMVDYGHRGEWSSAMRQRATANKRDGETTEMAMARLFKSDATMQAMRKAYGSARPAPASASNPNAAPAPSGPEAKLEKMAQDYASENDVSLIDARAAVAKSSEGRRIRAHG